VTHAANLLTARGTSSTDVLRYTFLGSICRQDFYDDLKVLLTVVLCDLINY